jgi:hypothetical protein
MHDLQMLCNEPELLPRSVINRHLRAPLCRACSLIKAQKRNKRTVMKGRSVLIRQRTAASGCCAQTRTWVRGSLERHKQPFEICLSHGDGLHRMKGVRRKTICRISIREIAIEANATRTCMLRSNATSLSSSFDHCLVYSCRRCSARRFSPSPARIASSCSATAACASRRRRSMVRTSSLSCGITLRKYTKCKTVCRHRLNLLQPLLLMIVLGQNLSTA